MFKYILFDFDNTLYDYEDANKKAIEKVFCKLNENFNLNNVNDTYEKEKKKFQNYCYNASSHNKFIQLKKIFEKYNLNLNQLTFYYDLYIDIFKNNLKLYSCLLDFLDLCSRNGIKMYILTNNTCKEQIERLQKLDLLKYFSKIYTSEEFGIEKPDVKLFYYVMQDINCNKNEIVKIGDNYKNDIEPLILNEIYAFWFNKTAFNIKKTHLEFNNYNMLFNFFKDYYNNVNEFLDISTHVGERFDLVQAGGGNISFKMGNIMFIKSSGCSLSSMNMNKNYVGLNFNSIKNRLKNIQSPNKKEREKQSKELVDSNIVFLKEYRPSIETSLHCLTHKYTVHLHPIQFNYISALENVDQILEKLFNDYCIIDYHTPGIDVTLELIKVYKQEKIIFMKNHGIVVTSDNSQDIIIILKNIIQKLESYLKLDLKKYHLVNDISYFLKQKYHDIFISYLVENEFINNYINKLNQENLKKCFQSFFPDKVVYCGISCVFLKKNKFVENINDYIKDYQEIPKIFIYLSDKKYMYISSNSLNKCRDIEQVLLSHLLCYKDDNIILKNEEIKYLNNWEAEKYRQIK